ncbi:MAG: gliding motility-associated C-terminal domain-containing protein, partial [Crocinitomicaceae bacterium]|nr:gliding motility-associated C-terminal domain-containing protein [Crocinitomicaceae bacterium]
FLLDDSLSQNELSIILTKSTELGEIIWQKVIPACNGGTALTTDNENNLILATNDTSIYAAVLKFNSDGDLLWSKRNNTILSYCKSIVATENHYYIFGSRQSFISWEYDYFVTKMDYNGTIIWSKVYDTGEEDLMGDGLLTIDNQLAFVGEFQNDFDVINFIQPVKLDTAGNIVWSTKISYGTNLDVKDLTQRSDGLFGVTGRIRGPYWKIFYTCFDETGTEIHRGEYIRSAFQEGYSIHGLDEGGFMLCLEPEDYLNNSMKHTAMMKINDAGAVENIILYEIADSGTFPFGARKTNDGFNIMGIMFSTRKVWLMKTDNDGYSHCYDFETWIDHDYLDTYTSPHAIFEVDVFPFADADFDVLPVSYTYNIECLFYDEDSIVHFIPEIPNVFTPNGDAINDFFQIEYPYENGYNLKIINRWGELIFESVSPNVSWDGRHSDNLKEAVEGTYFYKLTVGELSKHGTVTLIR